jgi:hypothetical protein
MTYLYSNVHNDNSCYSNDAYNSLWVKVLLCCKFIRNCWYLGLTHV